MGISCKLKFPLNSVDIIFGISVDSQEIIISKTSLQPELPFLAGLHLQSAFYFLHHGEKSIHA